MTDDNLTPTLGIILSGIMIGFLLGLLFGTVTARQETEEKTVMYCVEQPSACKVKYEFYKLENAK